MNGKILLKAAEILVKAGPQADAILEKFEELIVDALMRSGYKVDGDECDWDGTQDPSDTVCIDYYRACYFKERGKGKRKPSVVAAHVVVYNESMISKIDDFEPTLFVYYKSTADEYDVNSLEELLFDVSAVSIEGKILAKYDSDKKIDSCLYALPLVKINNDEIVRRDAVDTMVGLIGSNQKGGRYFADKTIAVDIMRSDDRVAYR